MGFISSYQKIGNPQQAYEEEIIWPANANSAHARCWGVGPSGGGSDSDVFGGGGASGAWWEAKWARPPSGKTFISLGKSGVPVPAGVAGHGDSGTSSTVFRDSINGDEWIRCSSNAGGGYPSVSRGGAEAGSPGVVSWGGPGPSHWLPGNMGQASTAGGNGSMTRGADAPGGGGGGACNGQNGGMGAGGGGGTSTLPSGGGGPPGFFLDFYTDTLG